MAENDLIVPFKEASDYFKQKISLPSKDWRDLEGRAHDRAFVIAGAIQDALLSDLRGSLQKAIDTGTTLEQFRKDFDAIVAKHGWSGWTGEDTDRGRAWRTTVIFETNMRTAYAAGRYAQMTDPDVTRVYKYWRYQHGYYRRPNAPRLKHKSWDGTVLPWNDPWWDSHYPPNDWGCSCGVEVLSERDLKNDGISVDRAPETLKRRMLDPKTNAEIMVPDGIGLGWDHAPGKDWSQGLVPVELQLPLNLPVNENRARNLPPLSEIAKPFKAKPLPEETSPDTAVAAFLSEFGAEAGKPALFKDAAGHAIVISDSLFQKAGGTSKADKNKRHLQFPLLAEALRDPDEIWISWEYRFKDKSSRLVRRYIKSAPNGLGFSSFQWSTKEWTGTTVFNPTLDAGGEPNPDYLDDQRTGALLYRRTALKR